MRETRFTYVRQLLAGQVLGEEAYVAGVRVVIFNECGEICCVRHAYGVKDWNVPGGGIDQGESLLSAVHREVLEETGIHVRVESLVGVYSVPASGDLIALFAATIQSQDAFASNEEIAEVAYFPSTALPQPMHPCMVRCLEDAIEGRRGVVRELNLDGTVQATLESCT